MRNVKGNEMTGGLTLDLLASNQEPEENESLESNGCQLAVWYEWVVCYVPPRLYQES